MDVGEICLYLFLKFIFVQVKKKNVKKLIGITFEEIFKFLKYACRNNNYRR